MYLFSKKLDKAEDVWIFIYEYLVIYSKLRTLNWNDKKRDKEWVGLHQRVSQNGLVKYDMEV